MLPSRNDDKGAGAQRTPSATNPMRNSTTSRASDNLSLSDIPIADGFRPDSCAPESSSSSSTVTLREGIEPSRPSAVHFPSNHFRNRPSSVAKPHRPHESLTLRHEHDSSSNSQPSYPRASIASSEGPVLRPESPYRGPTGPSHPYQMYPQRTLSNATSETTTPPSRESPMVPPQQGPTHPYSLYTQSTAEVEEVPVPSIPVGFSNAPDNYRRQLGPDGEEAGDLIGPMGHTEELPPYTRYPEIAYVMRKEAGNETDSISTPASSTVAVGVIPTIAAGAGGLGRATRDPEFSSTEEDLAMDRSRPSIRSYHSQASRHDINTAARGITEKSCRQEKWERRAKKKLWGIVPYWAICLVMVGMVLMGIIMGAVIGTVLKKSGDKTRKAIAESEAPPKAPVGEVVPYTIVPTDLEPLRVGFYSLPPLDKDEAPRKCFNNSLEFNAWSCDIPYLYYSIEINEIKNASKLSNYDLELNAFNETDVKLLWGTQPPSVPKPIPLTLVNDTFNMGRGPAWWLQIKYNKTVIVPEANFPLPERRMKRGWDYDNYPISKFDPSRLGRASKSAQEGDKPWICTWPDTTLEIFIYPNVNASLAALDKSSPSGTEPDYAQPTPAYGTGSTYANPRGEPTKAYPKAVKFLERRLSDDAGATAICRQVKVIAGGYDYEDAYNKDGEPVVVEIIETPSSSGGQMIANQKREVTRELYDNTASHNALARRDAQELTSCGCLWWST